MKKVEVKLEQGPEGEWWVNSDQAIGFFACGDTRDEALENARDALSLFLNLDENEISLEVVETKIIND